MFHLVWMYFHPSWCLLRNRKLVLFSPNTQRVIHSTAQFIFSTNLYNRVNVNSSVLVVWIFSLIFWTWSDHSLWAFVHPVQITSKLPLGHKDYNQSWIVASREIQNARFFLFRIHYLDVDAFQCELYISKWLIIITS